MKPDSLRVHAPTSVVFLCGGAIDEKLSAPAVLRDAFLRIARVSAPKYEIVLAEEAKPLTSEAGYNNLLTFEADIAQVVGLILLFVESAGSLAELGAFAALPTVSPRLLAVVDEFHYNQSSFVRHGPLQYLEVTQGEEAIISLDRAHVGIGSDGNIADLHTENFSSAILPAVQKRIDNRPQSEKFHPQNAGHVILLIVGLCQEYGALTQSEIREYLKILGVADLRWCRPERGWNSVWRIPG
jgi:hypothetical protein